MSFIDYFLAADAVSLELPLVNSQARDFRIKGLSWNSELGSRAGGARNPAMALR